MTVLYADYNCPNCKNEGKVMHELADGVNKIIFPGEAHSKEQSITVECEFCNEKTEAYIKVAANKFVGIKNKRELENSAFNTAPETEEVFNKWKKEKSISPLERIDFNKQPYSLGEKLTFANENFVVEKVYRTEWIEKDIDRRIELPRPDIYWYELSYNSGKKKWMKVENVKGDNVTFSDMGIVILDQSDAVENISSLPSKVKKIYQSEMFGGREIEAYQYINGVRIIVVNHKNEIEMDVFEDTFEEAMHTVEENTELSVFNE